MLDVSRHGRGALIRALGWAMDERIRGEARQGAERRGVDIIRSRTLLLEVDVVMMMGRSMRNVIVRRRKLGWEVRAMRALRWIHNGRRKGMNRRIETERRGPICDAG